MCMYSVLHSILSPVDYQYCAIYTHIYRR